MTISTDWVVQWKRENSAPFSAACAHGVDVVFIDGQVRLMQTGHATTWPELVAWGFANPVRRAFETGAHTVVLAFDDYARVPAAKNMTQRGRVAGAEELDAELTHANAALPAALPVGVWAACLRNRAFKTKVCRFVCETLPQVLRLAAGQRLILDNIGHPVEHTPEAGARELSELGARGESDVKFPRYARYGRMLVDSIDGDYLPIALLHLERAGPGAPDVSVLRYAVPTEKRGKRKAPGAEPRARPAREHVHVNALLASLRAAVARKAGAAAAAHSAGAEMRVLAALVTFTGCDFSKGLPFISAARVWDNLGLLWATLAKALDADAEGAAGALAVAPVADRAIARLYCAAYPRHAAYAGGGMAAVAERLKRGCALSETVRARLPEAASVECVVRNSNWVLAYWAAHDTYPDPIAARFGFARDAGGRAVWADDAARATPEGAAL